MKPAVQFHMLWLILPVSVAGVQTTGCTTNDEVSHGAVHIDQPDVDFGVIEETARPTRQVTILNEGAAHIHVIQIELSCGCLASNFKPANIPPGEHFSFELELSKPTIGPGVQYGRVKTEPALTPLWNSRCTMKSNQARTLSRRPFYSEQFGQLMTRLRSFRRFDLADLLGQSNSNDLWSST